MGFMRKILGPLSKYDKTLPYTYTAKVDMLKGMGSEPVFDYYYSSTICGLIVFLDENNISPGEVQLIGIYQDKEIDLDKKHCVSKEGNWLKRPALCRSLEKHYKNTMEECYRGHIEEGECSFEDRDQKGSGPF